MNFRKKGGGHANPNEFRCKFLGLPKKAQHCFPKRGGGGQKFSENSSIFVNLGVPNEHDGVFIKISPILETVSPPGPRCRGN